jgi:Tol biopolymer transport system component
MALFDKVVHLDCHSLYIIHDNQITEMKLKIIIGFITVLSWGCAGNQPEGCFPSEQLPPHIEPLTSFGERAEWSLDGKSVYFVDSAGGDVWVVDIGSKNTRRITKPEYCPSGHGYYRVLCLSSGDLLFTCGPERYQLYFQVMDGSLAGPPVEVPGEIINEGPAVSRKSMKIAWSPNHRQIFTGEISFHEGLPRIINKQLVIDSSQIIIDGIRYHDILEPQNFRPPGEKELIWSQYGTDDRGIFTSEVIGYHIETGKMTNYSKAPNQYDEPEGIFPDGEYTLVECDRHHPEGNRYIDLYQLRLDGTGEDYRRLTFFSEVEGFRASNPVVRDDGKMIAFQASLAGSAPGAGCGLYLFDLQKYKKRE